MEDAITKALIQMEALTAASGCWRLIDKGAYGCESVSLIPYGESEDKHPRLLAQAVLEDAIARLHRYSVVGDKDRALDLLKGAIVRHMPEKTI